MKKLLLILLSLFAFSLTGCVDDSQNDSDLKKKDHSQELIECIMNRYPDGFQLENGWYKISLSKKTNLEYYEYYEVNDIYAYINFDKSSFDGVITKMTSSKYTYKIIDSNYILFETSQVYLNDGYYISKTTQDGSKEIKFDKTIKSIKLSINLNETIFDLNRLNEEYNKNIWTYYFNMF